MNEWRRREAAIPSSGRSPIERARFDEVVLPHLDAAHNFARHLLRDPHDAEDAVQDAFVRAIRFFEGFRGVNARAWLLSIVRNTCLTRLRHRGAERVEFDEQLHSAEDALAGPEADFERAGAAATVGDALARLPLEYREALVLRELEGMSYKEIAEVSGVPIGTVMSRLARGRQKLMRALGAQAKEGA